MEYELKIDDTVCVNGTNADGMCGNGIYGFGRVVSVDNCRKQVTVNMRDQNFPSYHKDYTVFMRLEKMIKGLTS